MQYYDVHPGLAMAAKRADARNDLAHGDPKLYLKQAGEFVEAMFSGPKAALRPLYDRLYELARSLGKDIRISPGKTIVPIYRHHVIAQIKPSTRSEERRVGKE